MRLIPAAIVLAFTIYCVLDIVRADTAQVRAMPRPLWVVAVIIAPVVGGVAWLVLGRPRGEASSRAASPGARPPVLGPDDDPDFLRGLDRPRDPDDQ